MKTKKKSVRKTKHKKLGRRPQQGDGSRVDIIKAYLALTYEIGPDQITIERIAKKAGLTLGTVRYYFADAQPGLYAHSLKFHLDKVYRMLEERLSKERLAKRQKFDPLKTYIETMFEWISDPIDGCFELYSYFLCGTRDRFPDFDFDFMDIARTRIGSFLLEGIGAGRFKIPVNQIEYTAHQIHNIILGCCVSAMIDPNKRNFEKNRKIGLDLIFNKLLNARILRS